VFVDDPGDEASVDAGALRGEVDAIVEEAFAAFFSRFFQGISTV
jgi:hypothetical protein